MYYDRYWKENEMEDKELTIREVIIMNEAFMTGRVYNQLGEKESPAEISEQLRKNCINAIKRQDRNYTLNEEKFSITKFFKDSGRWRFTFYGQEGFCVEDFYQAIKERLLEERSENIENNR